MRFVKKVVVIEAVLWTGSYLVPPIPYWVKAAINAEPGKPGSLFRIDDKIHIGTLDAVAIASPGDWIVRGVKQELYPCKPDIFEALYEPWEDTKSAERTEG